MRGRSSLLVLRAAKSWQGRTLEGSGGSGARFWTRGLCVERVVTFGLGGRATFAGSWSSGLWWWRRALLDPWILRGRVVTFGFEGRETLAGACSKNLAGAARVLDPWILRGRFVGRGVL